VSAFEAFVLGVVQGLTEFLPVSSSGHLMVLQKMFGISAEGDGMLVFNILMHVGTLIAVFIVYWKRIWNMIRHPFKSELKWLVVATIPAVIAALTLDFDDAFEGKFIIWSFYLTSIVLVLSGFIGNQRRRQKKYHKDTRWYDALSMGIMQAIAILPGLSRSGSTIAGGLASGLTRKRAADFAFLMSIPAILGANILDVGEALAEGGDPGLLPIYAVGVVVAAVSGYLCLKLLRYVAEKGRFGGFAYYCWFAGALTLILTMVL